MSLGILAGTRHIHLRMSNMWKMSHGYSAKKKNSSLHVLNIRDIQPHSNFNSAAQYAQKSTAID